MSAATLEPLLRFSENNLYGLPAILVEEGPWRFILRGNGRAELYDVLNDPGEQNNLADRHPERVASYRQLAEPRLATWLQGTAGEEGVELSQEQIEALRSLGYVQ